MIESDEVDKDKNETDLTKGGVGDVETAGETTAASAITGPVDDRPVGADTLAKVDDTQKPSD
ncbi:MAG TPA: hypothetical protein VM911_23200 [Pyrinomonadaceae bacterium]|nr:hypothetical protein [Pyrinomonadaceae bacterium]